MNGEPPTEILSPAGGRVKSGVGVWNACVCLHYFIICCQSFGCRGSDYQKYYHAIDRAGKSVKKKRKTKVGEWKSRWLQVLAGSGDSTWKKLEYGVCSMSLVLLGLICDQDKPLHVDRFVFEIPDPLDSYSFPLSFSLSASFSFLASVCGKLCFSVVINYA